MEFLDLKIPSGRGAVAGGERCRPLGGNIPIGGNNLFAACYRNVSGKKRNTGKPGPGTLDRDPSGTLRKPENRDPTKTGKTGP